MRLILKVISYKGSPLPDGITTEFTEQGGSIGRKPGNTMILPDSDHFVSGKHAEILYRDGQFVITDTSTNGTILANSGMELKNNSAPLQANEMLKLGEYDVSVEIISDPAQIFDTPFDNAFAPAPPIDPFASPFSSKPFSNEPPPSDLQNIRPLFSDLEPIGPAGTNQPPKPQYKEPTPSSPFQDSFAIPDVTPAEPANQDISEFLKGLDSLSPTGNQSNQETPFQPNEPAFFQEVSPPPPPTDQKQSGPLFEPPIAESRLPKEPIGAVAPPQSPQTPETVSSLTNGDTELLNMFLTGAGISDHSFLAAENTPESMRLLGGLFRNLVEGLMDVLRARAEMKSEFRVSMTTIRSFDNNPLKFNPDVESVLKLLMSPKNPAFTDPETAVKEAFKDIKLHQLAMTAGIQASLTEILSRFNPNRFETILGEGLMFQRKARCWELYCEKYPELRNQAQEEFFGDEFAEAYEKQMLLLSKRQN
ncbi:MAG: type VI secretion system-associated FHA domain protein TagH [Gammaproteobacteria bacterium]